MRFVKEVVFATNDDIEMIIYEPEVFELKSDEDGCQGLYNGIGELDHELDFDINDLDRVGDYLIADARISGYTHFNRIHQLPVSIQNEIMKGALK